ncbi:ATP-binding protein [Nonomuraea ferruginea]
MNGSLVGRATELSRLVRVLEAAAAGTAGVALVGGDAGIGKTRLTTELVAEARERGFRVLVGQCAELGDTLPYLPLADALRGAEPAVAAAAAAHPLLGQLLPGTETAPQAGLTQQRLFGSLLGLLNEVQPVLFVIEDLHWADRSTRDLLVFLSRMVQTERVCVAGTYRTDDIHRRHPLRSVLAELKRLPTVTSVELGPLGAGEMSDYVSTLGSVAARDLGLIISRADGNPFYAEELFAALAEGDDLPDGLASLLMSRVEVLSEPGQRVLRAAAVARPPRRGRAAARGLRAAAAGVRGGGAGDRLARAAPRPRPGLRVPPRPAAGGGLQRPAARRAHPAPRRLRPPAHLARRAGPPPPRRPRPGRARWPPPPKPSRQAERLGAPAEAHNHYDRALGLWDRVDRAEELAERDPGDDRPPQRRRRRRQRRQPPRRHRPARPAADLRGERTARLLPRRDRPPRRRRGGRRTRGRDRVRPGLAGQSPGHARPRPPVDPTPRRGRGARPPRPRHRPPRRRQGRRDERPDHPRHLHRAPPRPHQGPRPGAARHHRAHRRPGDGPARPLPPRPHPLRPGPHGRGGRGRRQPASASPTRPASTGAPTAPSCASSASSSTTPPATGTRPRRSRPASPPASAPSRRPRFRRSPCSSRSAEAAPTWRAAWSG